MRGRVEVAGYEFVAPLEELSRPLEEYFEVFVGKPVDVWAGLTEHEAKDFIHIACGSRSLLSGETSHDVHEILARGGAGGAALVPWNMVCLTRAEHNRMHSGDLRIERYDPLDPRHGLVVYEKSQRIPRRDLYFYSQPRPYLVQAAHDAAKVVRSSVLARINNDWEAAKRLAWLYENNGEIYMNADSFNAVCAELGLSPTAGNRMRRVYEKARSLGVADLARGVSIERASQIFLHVPEEKIPEALIDARGQSGADFKKAIGEYKRTSPKMHKYVVINDGKIRLVRTDSYGGLKGVVVKGDVVKDVDGVVIEEL